MKWSFPHFDYKGEMMCSMAAFKQHCAFGFWKTALMKDAKKMLDNRKEAMGSLGRITSLKDLPDDKTIIAYIKEAMKLNDAGIKTKKAKPGIKTELKIPTYFTTALKKNKKVFTSFNNSSYSCKKEYVEWVTEAKTEDTRQKRLAKAIALIAEGKTRYRKYK
jgi:uncharacterized protein YdeI (YjbR/CyaY-like superfamily)